MVTTLTANRLAELIDGGEELALVDTREEESYESWHVPGAVHFPFGITDELDGRLEELRDLVGDRDRVITICGKGISSGSFAVRLADATDEFDVGAVEGGMEAWSRVYDRVSIDVGGPTVVQVQRRAKGCLGYLVADPDAGEAVVVDPTADVDQFILAAGERGLEIAGVIDTHVHADHVSGGKTLADSLDIPYYMGEHASDRGVEREFDPLADGDTLEVGNLEIEVLYTPGHTSDMITLVVSDHAVLTADTLHADSTGRTELEESDDEGERGARLLYQSLQETILELPDDLVVLPGHVNVDADGEFSTASPGDPVWTTIGDAREGIEALSLDEEAFVDRMSEAGEEPANFEEIIEINRGVRDLEPESRDELETGPNNCSA
ncbi:MBL fold metallo-hydrolase [Natrialbaceae archaeon A-gly3]